MAVQSPQKSRRIRMAALWLVFLAAAYILILHMEYRHYEGRAKEELRARAAVITEQIPRIARNSLDTQIFRKTTYDRLKALALFLSDKGDPSDRKDFLDEYLEASGLTGLVYLMVVFDTSPICTSSPETA